MINAANDQTHQVRFGPDICIRQNGILSSHQYQYSDSGYFPAIIFPCKKVSINQADDKEKQCRQTVGPYADAKQFKTYQYGPKRKMRFIKPVAVIGKQLKKVFFIKQVFSDGSVQAGVVSKKLNIYFSKSLLSKNKLLLNL